MTIRWNLSTGTDGAESVTAVIDGEFYVAEKDHPNYQDIKAACADRLVHADPMQQTKTDEQIRDLFDVSFKVGQKFDDVGSERVKISGGQVYLDGTAVHDSLTEAIMRFISEGVDDWQPLVRFFEKIKTNPQTHSQQYLYDWLTDNKFTIAKDGDIVAYKSLNNDFTSVHSGPAIVNGVSMNGNVPNMPGSVIEIPRDRVAFDPTQTCSFGLHAATYSFAESFTRGPVVKLKINPRDVVSVPVDAGGQKMRVCRYFVVEQVREALTTVVDPHVYSEESDAGYEDYKDEYEEDDEDLEEIDLTHEERESVVQDIAQVEGVLSKLKRRLGLG